MSSAPPEEAEQEQSFLSHLIELRTRIVRAAVSVLIALLALSPFMKQIYDFLAAPMLAALPQGSKMIATGIITPFLVPLKVTLLAAFVLALPYVLYQAWAFVAPGLYRYEKRLAFPIVISSYVMFLAGVAFCYFVVFRFLFPIIAGFAPTSISVSPDIEAYFGFVLTMFVAFGLTFETPVVIVVLTRLGIVSIERLKSVRPYFVVVAFIIAAIVTPPDVTSQMMLALPLIVLYQLGLCASAALERFAPRARDESPRTA